jgi:hypothetical protein
MAQIIHCTFCSSEATHTLRRDKATQRWVSTRADGPHPRPAYCERCSIALANGESSEQLSRRLNEEYRVKDGDLHS